jgi:hypothetical protein
MAGAEIAERSCLIQNCSHKKILFEQSTLRHTVHSIVVFLILELIETVACFTNCPVPTLCQKRFEAIQVLGSK